MFVFDVVVVVIVDVVVGIEGHRMSIVDVAKPLEKCCSHLREMNLGPLCAKQSRCPLRGLK